MPVQFSPFVLNHNMYLRGASTAAPTLYDVLQSINGNSGNSVIAPALSCYIDFGSQVSGIANMFATGALMQHAPEEINQRHSHLLILFQDQIKLHRTELPWTELANWLSKITIPVVPIGIGANTLAKTPQEIVSSLPKDMIRFLNLMSDKSKFISVRGSFTADVLVKLNIYNVKETGCPSFFINGPDFSINKNALTSAQEKNGKIAGTGLFACKEPQRVHYFLQDELLLLRTFNGTFPTMTDLGENTYPNYNVQVLAAVQEGRIQFHTDPQNWIKALKDNFILACGSRVHGSIMAILAGVPAMCTSGDMRAKELCAHFRIPHQPGVAMTEYTAEQIYEQIDLNPLNRAYPERYMQFIDFLKASGLSPRYQNERPMRAAS